MNTQKTNTFTKKRFSLLNTIIEKIQDKQKAFRDRQIYASQLQGSVTNKMVDQKTIESNMDKYCDLEVIQREYLNKIDRLDELQKEAIELSTGTNIALSYYRMISVGKEVDIVTCRTAYKNLLVGNWVT